MIVMKKTEIKIQHPDPIKAIADLSQQLQSGEVKIADLSPDMQQALFNRKIGRELDARLDQEVKEAIFDIETTLDVWLENKYTKTKVIYRQCLSRFQEYILERNLNILKFNIPQTMGYVNYLTKQGLSANSINIHTSAVSSFLSYLEEIEMINKNPFKSQQVKTPKARRTKKLHVPSVKDMNTILNILDTQRENDDGRVRNKAIRLYPAIAIIEAEGFRADALHTLYIEDNGYCKGISKEHDIVKHLYPHTMNMLKMSCLTLPEPFKKHKTDTTEKGFYRFTTKLWRENRIQHKYSIHMVRHFAALREYELSQHDIEHLRIFLCHKDVRTSQLYLAGKV